MKRFVLLEDPGRSLFSMSATDHRVVRCETPSISTEMRFGDTRLRESLAFIPLEIPIPGEASRSITFGLVREGGNWKLLSVGLILLDIPSMEKQWEQADLEARENDAIAALRKLATALETYRRAYGKLPDALDTLGPAPQGGISPEAANLVDADLSAGNKADMRFDTESCQPAATCQRKRPTRRQNSNLQPPPSSMARPAGGLLFWIRAESCVEPTSEVLSRLQRIHALILRRAFQGPLARIARLQVFACHAFPHRATINLPFRFLGVEARAESHCKCV